jgi:MFS family permease
MFSKTGCGPLTDSKIYSGPILVLGIVGLIESLAIALPLSYFPNYVVGLGASVASVGVFTSSFMIAFAVLSPKMGDYVDRYGRKKMMMLGIASDVVLGALTGLVPSWEWLLLIRLVNGAVASGAMLASQTLLIDIVDPERRGEASGFLMSMNMIGRNLGPLMGGGIQWISLNSGLSLLMSYRIPYFVDAALALFALVIAHFKVVEPERAALSMRGRPGGVGGDLRSFLTRPLRVLLVYAFVTGIGVGFIIPIMVLFYTDKFATDSLGIGALLSISGFIGLMASYIAGRLSDRFGRRPLIAIGNYTSRMLGFLLPLTPDMTQAGVVMSLRSLGFNVSMPAFRALQADLVPAEARGRVFGLFGTAFTAGSVVGPIIGTWIYSMYRHTTFNVLGFSLPGYGIPFFINSVLGVLTTTFVLLMITEKDIEAQRTRSIPTGQPSN